VSGDSHPFFGIFSVDAARVCKSNYVEMNYDPLLPPWKTGFSPPGAMPKATENARKSVYGGKSQAKWSEAITAGDERSLHLGSLATDTQQWGKSHLLKI